MAQSNTKYVLSADVVRVIAIVGTVVIHLVHTIYSRPDFLGGSTWWLANLLNAFSRTAIPLFVMLSGYLLLPRTEPIRSTVWRTVQRLVVPLVIWFFLYRIWDVWYLSKKPTWSEMGPEFFSGGVYHLYFLVIMIGLYLFLPWIRILVAKGNEQLYRYVLGLSLSITVSWGLIQSFIMRDSLMTNFFTWWVPYLGYFLLGYAFRYQRISLKWNWALVVISFLTTLILGYINLVWFSQGQLFFWSRAGLSYFDEYLSINIFIFACALFHLLVHAQYLYTWISRTRVTSWLLQQLSQAAFAVYLIHSMVINVVDLKYGYAIEFLDQNMMIYLLSRTIIVLVSCFVLGWVVTKLPIVRWLVGQK